MDRRGLAGAAVAAVLGALLALVLLGSPEDAPDVAPVATAPAPTARPATRPEASDTRRVRPTRAPSPAAEPDPEPLVATCAFPDPDARGVAEVLGRYQGDDAVTVDVADGELTLTFPRLDFATVTARLPYRSPVEIEVRPGDGGLTCAVRGDAAPTTRVVGTVSNPGEGAMVVGCGAVVRVPPSGDFVFETPRTTRCGVYAQRMDGALKVLSRIVEVRPDPGDVVELELELPRRRQGGMGVAFQPGDAGVDVLSVHEGTPAWDAGLIPGDRILAVDGEVVGGMSADDFIWLGVGDEGSPVLLEVEHRDGSVEEIEIVRAFIRG